ncbi:TPA: hypothetical protein RQJ43_004470 [Vibrio vulnificus]|nr:hypothetical protein [Vibrio vulnificus]
MEKEKLLIDYEDNKPLYEQFARSMESLITILLTTSDIIPHSVSSRVKDRVSLGKKIEKKDKYSSISEVTDIVGIRIITHYSDEVDQIAKLIEKEFFVDRDNSVDKRTSLDPDRFGYLSLHYVASLSENRSRLIEYSKFEGIKLEIQVRSILQHTWAEIEHDIGYKSKVEVPRIVRRKFSQLAGLLELADEQFIHIRDELEEYEKDVKDSIVKTPQNVTFDKVSIYNYLKSSELVEKIDSEVANVANAPLRELSKDFAGRFIKYLSYFNIETIPKLEKLLSDNHDLILLRSRDIKATQGSLSKGISVFLLFQVLASHLETEEEVLDFLDEMGLLSSSERKSFASYLFALGK